LLHQLPPIATAERSTEHTHNAGDGGHNNQERSKFARSVLEGSTVALIFLLGLALGGYGYSLFYKRTVRNKIENAFSKGYSSQERVALGRIAYGAEPDKIQEIVEKEFWMPRDEQAQVDDIVSGKTRGKYYLIIGERGTGKRALLIEAMRKVHGDGVAMLEAHSELEVFRTRLGKAIDYEFHEDYIGGLFSIRGPRDSTPLLDIERALNQLEKVALSMRKRRGKPLLMVINNIHLSAKSGDLVDQRASHGCFYIRRALDAGAFDTACHQHAHLEHSRRSQRSGHRLPQEVPCQVPQRARTTNHPRGGLCKGWWQTHLSEPSRKIERHAASMRKHQQTREVMVP
jgi:hypothetical protein